MPASTVTYTIQGTVSSILGPIAGIEVEAFSSSSNYLATTIADGTYSVTGVPAGTYRVKFTDPTRTYLDGYYDSSSPPGNFNINSSSATPVQVSGNVTGISVTLGTGYHIKGRVTGPGGTGLQGIEVEAYSFVYDGFSSSVDDGTYSVLVPPNDSYTLWFIDPTGTYLNGFYDSSVSGSHFTADQSSATLVQVVTSDVLGLDVQMPLAPLWSVTLGASATTVTAGTTVTLTATANKDVEPTEYEIVILASDGTVLNSCGSGTTCTATVTSGTDASETYHAIVGYGDGSLAVATSNPLAVTWIIAATYHPMTPPVRLLDTRSGNGLSGKLLANTPATFQVANRDGIPVGATAVTGNVTVVNSTNSWAIYLGPDPVANPSTSTINFSAGEVTGNGLTVALGSGGSLSATYISTPGNTTDLVFDVTGYFTPDMGGATYHAMTPPTRLLDTRSGNGLGGKLLANTPATFNVAGRNGIPGAAIAVTGNVTVVNSTNSWAIYLGPDPIANPGTSTINFSAGQVKGNSLTVALGGGTLSATYISTPGNTTDLVFDVTGYFMP